MQLSTTLIFDKELTRTFAKEFMKINSLSLYKTTN